MVKSTKKYILSFCIYIVLTVILFFKRVFLVKNINNIQNKVIVSYLNQNSDEMFEFLNGIDKTLFSVVSINDKSEVENFSLEQKLDFANAYIIQNFERYNEKIKYIENDFIFYTNDTPIYSIGYVDKEIIEQIVFEIFGRCDIIFEEYKFYDEEMELVALVPFFMENTGYEKVEMVDIKKEGKNTYVVTLNYTRNFENLTNSFFVDYMIKNEGKNNYLTAMKIYNSKLY